MRIYNHHTVMRYLCGFLALVIALWGIAFGFLAWFPCLPVHTYWDGVGGRCYGFGDRVDRTTFMVHTATNMAFDFLVTLAAIPIAFGESKRSKTRRRIGTIVIMLVVLGCS